MGLFSLHSACTAIGAWGWMHAARRYQTTHLLALAPLLQCSMLMLLYGGLLPKALFYCFSAFHGFAGGKSVSKYVRK